jgi:DNA-binding transcriptional LysR family regulator
MNRFLGIDAFIRVVESSRFVEAARQKCVSRSAFTAHVQPIEA